MAVLRTSVVADGHIQRSRVRDGMPNGIQIGTRSDSRVRSGLAMVVYSAGYPLLALALWVGARNGDWFRATVFVALGVLTSFVGWALLGLAHASHAAAERERHHQAISVYLALYNRAGAIIVLLGSYAIVATAQGWPAPGTFIGWFAVAWIPLFVSFAIPVESNSSPPDPNA